jgi:hypothetical protein
MALNGLVFLVLGLVLWGTYRLLEVGSVWLNRRGTERERRSFLEIARRELGVEPISTGGRASDDLLLAGRVEDSVVRVTRQQVIEDFGPEPRWLVEIEDPAFDAPRAELPAMVEALRKTSVLPDGFSLEPGKLRYTEPAKSIREAVDRIHALLALFGQAGQ